MRDKYLLNKHDAKITALYNLIADENSNYTLEELSCFSKYSKSALAKKLLIILNSELTKETLVDSDFVLKIFPYLSEIFNDKNFTNYEALLPIVNEAYQTIQGRLQNDYDSIHKDEISVMIAKRTITLLEELKVLFIYDFKNYYYGDKYSLMKYLVFEEKNSSYVKEIIASFPYIVNITDQHHICIFENLVTTYLDNLYDHVKWGSIVNTSDIIYFNKIIDMILESPKFTMDSKLRDKLEKRIKYFQDLPMDDLSDVALDLYKTELSKLADKVSIYEHKTTSVKDLAKSFNIRTDFDSVALSDFSLYAHPISTSSNNLYIPFTKDYIISIDGEGTREIDDALSVSRDGDNLILGVHIANPSEFIPFSSLLDEEARYRTSSAYIDSSTMIPMIPEEITKNYLSLNQGVKRFATSYFFTITPEGEIIQEKFLKTIITVDKNMTYKSANNAITAGCYDPRLRETLNNLEDVVDRLGSYFHFDDVYEEMKHHDKDYTGTRITGTTKAEKIVEYCMAITNHRIARYAANKGMPFIYRNHVIDEEAAKRIEQYKEQLKESRDTDDIKDFLDRLIGLMPKGFYDIENKGHAGLKFSAYSHNTSPIRRYADLANCAALDTWYFRKPVRADVYSLESELSMISREINEKRESLNDFVKTYCYRKNSNQPKKKG